MFQNVIETTLNHHMPVKHIKFNKYKHKKTKWITYGIIKSIKTRDTLYKELRKCNLGTDKHYTLKINLQTYNKIIKNTIKQAKLDYYTSQFNRLKNDISNTWKTIGEVLNKCRKAKQLPEFF